VKKYVRGSERERNKSKSKPWQIVGQEISKVNERYVISIRFLGKQQNTPLGNDENEIAFNI